MSLRFVLLALLSKEPNTGYGVGRLLNHEYRHVWEARLQQIYGELGKLQMQGLVEAESIDLPNRPAKKIYSLTPQGYEALDRWLAERPAPGPCKDDLLVRLCCLPRMPRDVIIRQLEERRDACGILVRELEQRLAQTPRTDPAELGQLLTLEAAICRAEAQASWCARAVALLQESEDRRSGAEEEPANLSRRAAARAARA